MQDRNVRSRQVQESASEHCIPKLDRDSTERKLFEVLSNLRDMKSAVNSRDMVLFGGKRIMLKQANYCRSGLRR